MSILSSYYLCSNLEVEFYMCWKQIERLFSLGNKAQEVSLVTYGDRSGCKRASQDLSTLWNFYFNLLFQRLQWLLLVTSKQLFYSFTTILISQLFCRGTFKLHAKNHAYNILWQIASRHIIHFHPGSAEFSRISSGLCIPFPERCVQLMCGQWSILMCTTYLFVACHHSAQIKNLVLFFPFTIVYVC